MTKADGANARVRRWRISAVSAVPASILTRRPTHAPMDDGGREGAKRARVEGIKIGFKGFPRPDLEKKGREIAFCSRGATVPANIRIKKNKFQRRTEKPEDGEKPR